MAIDNLHRALATALGLEIYKPGTNKAISKKVLQASFIALMKGGQMAGRAALPVAARALPPVARAVANPYIGVPLGVAAATYGTQQYLEESGIQEEVNVIRDRAIAALLPTARKATKKRQSIYNKAVSRAMKAVKKSTKGGPKGTLSNAQKTFGQVSKAVSRAKKGGKLSPKGVTGVIKRSISGLFKPKPKKRRSSKGSYTLTVQQ